MAITHHSYKNGIVQSLGYENHLGFDVTVGVIDKADDYDFGIAERREEIQVLDGTIIGGDGRVYNSLLNTNKLVFEKGERIAFCVIDDGPVAYRCLYTD